LGEPFLDDGLRETARACLLYVISIRLELKIMSVPVVKFLRNAACGISRRAVLTLVGMFAVLSCEAATRDHIIVVGSSTVFPFSALVAEHFSRSGPFPVASVSASSTAEGFRLFCAGPGIDTPDISNASRPISTAERTVCAQSGVKQMAEIRIGYDSLIVANSVAANSLNLTMGQLWLAVAGQVPVRGRLTPNPYQNWSDIDPSLPHKRITLLGPSVGHGTRDAFVELVMEPSCRAALAGIAASPEERERACARVRTDGHWVDVENIELTLGKLASNREALGILTYSYLEQFANRIHAAKIDGVEPSVMSISSGVYPLSRPLFIYVKQSHLRSVSGLADFATEFLSFCAAGTHGYLADEGLVPLPSPELLRQRAAVAALLRR
jgi:phosphate transport system substrate-binding protein